MKTTTTLPAHPVLSMRSPLCSTSFSRVSAAALGALSALLLGACTSSSTPGATTTTTTVPRARVFAVNIVLPEQRSAGLAQAAADVVAVVRAQGGCAAVAGSDDCEDALSLTLQSVDAAPSADSFRFVHDSDLAWHVESQGDLGAANALYQLAADLGAVWIHPEEPMALVHTADALLLPGAGAWSTPRFAMRGFHEHTQHPIPMSDYLLRPGNDDYRARVSRYLQWMARNRQNVLFFHGLRTLDLATWTPYMAGIAEEARGFGVHLGVVVGFADEQQHAFKLIQTASKDPDADIKAGLDAILASGVDYVGFQIGTSEFTKPADADVLHWLDVATTHVKAEHPSVTPYAWIHITCSVKDEQGGYFFHLPLQAPEGLGAFVHTTMFYTLTDPAPVYDCEDFSHQLDFVDAAEGNRQLVFFPETAWWLGFDNNVPLVLPITGASRQRDIELLNGRDVAGHVTFTSGREWTYWQYDHYLTRATWSGETWDDYVAAISGLYGSDGTIARAVIRGVTAVQERVLYTENPELIFYLAGELPQDEAGAAAGILARRPKIAFRTVRDYDDAAFEAWRSKDYEALVSMEADLARVLAPLDRLSVPALTAESTQRDKLLVELDAAYRTLHDRVRHALHLYAGVMRLRERDRDGAEAELAAARTLSEAVVARVALVEATYRDPLEILAQEKPDTLTAYPIGYLYETHTGYFWTRRDQQLADLITDTFDAAVEAWTDPAPSSLYAVDASALTMTVPSDPVAASVIGGFVPRLLLGLSPRGDGAVLAFGSDSNNNALPDPGTEVSVSDLDILDGRVTGTTTRVPLVVRDSAGAAVGNVGILDATFDFAVSAGGVLGDGTLAGGLETQPLIEAVLAIAGIDRAGIESLVKSVFGLPADEPLPPTVPVAFGLAPSPL